MHLRRIGTRRPRRTMKDRKSQRFLLAFLVAIFACLPCTPVAHAQWTAMNPVKQVQQQPDGARLHDGYRHSEGAGVLGFDHSCPLFADGYVSRSEPISS